MYVCSLQTVCVCFARSCRPSLMNFLLCTTVPATHPPTHPPTRTHLQVCSCYRRRKNLSSSVLCRNKTLGCNIERVFLVLRHQRCCGDRDCDQESVVLLLMAELEEDLNNFHGEFEVQLIRMRVASLTERLPSSTSEIYQMQGIIYSS